jgi:hypothetical protein
MGTTVLAMLVLLIAVCAQVQNLVELSEWTVIDAAKVLDGSNADHQKYAMLAAESINLPDCEAETNTSDITVLNAWQSPASSTPPGLYKFILKKDPEKCKGPDNYYFVVDVDPSQEKDPMPIRLDQRLFGEANSGLENCDACWGSVPEAEWTDNDAVSALVKNVRISGCSSVLPKHQIQGVWEKSVAGTRYHVTMSIGGAKKVCKGAKYFIVGEPYKPITGPMVMTTVVSQLPASLFPDESNADGGGLSTGATVAIVLVCIGVVAIAALVYRARQQASKANYSRYITSPSPQGFMSESEGGKPLVSSDDYNKL